MLHHYISNLGDMGHVVIGKLGALEETSDQEVMKTLVRVRQRSMSA